MPVYALGPEPHFPPVDHADPSGLLAVGGGLEPERLLVAYASGIFPWYAEDLPILWHAPDPRMVLLTSELHVGRTLRRRMAQAPYEITFDEAFVSVMAACADTPRPGQDGTWITEEMLGAYEALHTLGFAHSCEAWKGEDLVGGLYGVCLGGVFFGESMFTREADASKIAFVHLVESLHRWGVELVDCQVHTEHMERFGARLWRRERFQKALEGAMEKETRRGKWRFASSTP